MTSTDKSKKRRHNNINKVKLWNIFDNEVNADKKPLSLECIYRKSGNREICERCEYKLALSDEGFLVCTNYNCGIIYKDMVDQSAEWRYYGADDNQHNDPTRCGMPSNQHIQDTSLSTVILGKGFEVYRKLNSWNGLTYKQRSLIGILNKIATRT